MNSDSQLLTAALSYAARGWRVVPLHTPLADGRCDCRQPDCSVGKHPRTKNGLTAGTTDAEQIRRWWSMWPGANIGIVTGADSGLVALDIDPRHNGDDSLAELQQRHGRLPDTVEALTGSGGRHILFRHPGGRVGNSQGRLGPGLDTRGDGGYIVAAPSLHASGRKYEWEASSEPATTELADLPAWLPELLAPPERPSAPAGTVAPESALRRASAWLALRDPAVEGQGGDAHTFRTCANLVNDFGLSPDDAWPLLLEWNQRCVPPWDERGLRAKLNSALKNGKHARGSKEDRPLRAVPPPHTDGDAPPSGFDAPLPDEPPPWLDEHLPPPAGRTDQRQPQWEGNAAKVVEIRPKPQRPMKSRSYLTLITILETERLRAKVLANRKLEFNEMAAEVTLDRSPITDVDYGIIRTAIEREFERNSDGDGMQFGLEDVFRAVNQVAHQFKYHPVREYLEGLEWDGVERLALMPKDVLRADDTPLNRILVRKFFVSAVARALRPGAKVDTMLILTGVQAARKSTFFEVLAGEWFCDEAVDIHSKDAFLTMARTWIHEWSELETMAKARDVDALKAFLSKRHDTYRPPYGRSVVRIPRSCVIVGTTNRREFLTDETGERRYWPIVVGSEIDIDTLRSIRDQLWAEAVAAFEAGEQWWLTRDEGIALEHVHAKHTVTDAWCDLVLDWLEARDTKTVGWPTTGEVIQGALSKPAGQWNRGDEMRVAKILTRAGYLRKQGPRDDAGHRRWMWLPREQAEQLELGLEPT